MYCRKCDERVFHEKEDVKGYHWPYFMQLCGACWPSKVITTQEMSQVLQVSVEEIEAELDEARLEDE